MLIGFMLAPAANVAIIVQATPIFAVRDRDKRCQNEPTPEPDYPTMHRPCSSHSEHTMKNFRHPPCVTVAGDF